MNSDYHGPINIGNPNEFTINQLASFVKEKINKKIKFKRMELPMDDPMQRRPDIKLAKKELNWEPKISLDDGLDKTISYFKKVLEVNC